MTYNIWKAQWNQTSSGQGYGMFIFFWMLINERSFLLMFLISKLCLFLMQLHQPIPQNNNRILKNCVHVLDE